MWRIRLFLLAIPPLLAQTPLPETASWNINGRVVNEVDGKPIAKANLTVVSEDRSVRLETVSGPEGEFRFTGMRPGRYALITKHPRYLEARYGARTARSAGTPIHAEPGDEPRRIEVRMTPPSAISGRVLDDEGSPIAGVAVAVLMRQYQRGRMVWLPHGAGPISRSDDRGEYRAFGLPPGRYVVAALPANHFALQGDRRPNSGEAETGYASVYYPAAPSLTGAQIFEVRAGAEIRGIDLFLRKSKVYRVWGRVVLPEGRGPEGQLNIMTNRWSTSGAPLREDGTFEVRNLAPGPYTLFVRVEGEPRLTVRARLEVADSDIRDFVLEPEPAHVITGRVTFPSGVIRETVTVVLRSTADDVFFSVLSGRSRPDGTFQIEGVPAGRYRVEVAASNQAAYPKAVKSDGSDVLDRDFEVAGRTRIDIAMANDAGAVEGEVRKDEAPLAGALVVLAPNGVRRGIPHYFRFATADTSGRYRIEGVVPGEYTLFAFDNVDPDRCYDPDFVAEHQKKGLRVTVGAGSAQQLTASVVEVQ